MSFMDGAEWMDRYSALETKVGDVQDELVAIKNGQAENRDMARPKMVRGSRAAHRSFRCAAWSTPLREKFPARFNPIWLPH